MSGDTPGTDDARQKWLDLIGEPLPLQPEAVFPEVKGLLVGRRNKARANLLRALAPLLRRTLEQGEEIHYAARGVLYSAGEMYFSGYMTAYYANMHALVLTDRRVLLLYVDSKGKPRDIKNQLRRERIRAAKRGGFGGYLTLSLADGKSLMFMGVPKADAKPFLEAFPKQAKQPKDPTPSLESLCPSCLRVVEGKAGSIAACTHEDCRVPFRSAMKAAWLSALMPGVGDLYLRHYTFGALEFVGSVASLAMALFFAVMGLAGQGGGESAFYLFAAGAFFLAPRFIDFFVTLHMGRKGLVPLSSRPLLELREQAGAIGPGTVDRLPLFPKWAYLLFTAGAVAVVGAGAAAVPVARAELRDQELCKVAERGEVESAMEAWQVAHAGGDASDEERGRFALCLYRGGGFSQGDSLVEAIGGRPIEEGLAGKINTFVEELGRAMDAYNKGTQALIEGDEDQAWPLIDRAIAFCQTIARSPIPTSRDGVRVKVAGQLLALAPDADQLSVAERLIGTVKQGAEAQHTAVVKARLLAASGDHVRAREQLAAASGSALAPEWAMLALETRVLLQPDPAQRLAIAEQADAIAFDGHPEEQLLKQRRTALKLKLTLASSD